MTRVLMVLPDGTLEPGYSGAASRYVQNFQALHHLCAEVHVLRVCPAEQMAELHAYEAGLNGVVQSRSQAESWIDVTIQPTVNNPNRWQTLRRSLLNPIDYQYPAGPLIRQALQTRIAELKPGLLWLERTGTVAAAGQTGIPTIFSHHDIAYRVQAVRHAAAGRRQQYFQWVQRRAEQSVVRQAQHIVTGSATDAQRLRAIGCKNVTAIPVAYAPRPAPPVDARAESGRLRVIHLGSLETTANRIGLLDYLQKAHHPATQQCAAAGAPLDLWIIGDNRRVHPTLAQQLTQDNIHQTGFVPDLSRVLCPFDIAILPYDHDTGYRTKLPLLMSFAQVVITTKAAIAGTLVEGLGEGCVIVDGVEDFPAALSHLASHPEERQRLGRAAYRFFMQHFIYEAILPQYRRFVEQVVRL